MSAYEIPFLLIAIVAFIILMPIVMFTGTPILKFFTEKNLLIIGGVSLILWIPVRIIAAVLNAGML